MTPAPLPLNGARPRGHGAPDAGALRRRAVRVCDGVDGRLRWSSPHLARRIAYPRPARTTDFDVFAPATLGDRMQAPLLWRAVLWTRRLSARPVARDTNFYYSFLVLPADKRQRDHCRLGLLPRRRRCGRRGAGEGAAKERAGRERIAAGAASSRAASTAARRRRARASRSPPLIARFSLPRAPFEALIEGVEMDLGTPPLRDVRRSLRVLHPRRVGRRADLPRTSSAIAIRRRGSMRSISASRCSSPTSCATCPSISRRAASTSPQEDLRAHGCSEADLAPKWRSRRRRPFAGGQGAAAPAGAPRPRYYAPRRARAAARGRAPARRRGDHGRDLPGDPATGSTARLRRVLARRPHSPAEARARLPPPPGRGPCCSRDVPATSSSSAPALPVSAPRPRWPSAARACCVARGAAAAWRTGDRVPRPRDRRARRQRPARALRLLPRDVQLPAPHRRRRSRPHAAVAGAGVLRHRRASARS